MARPPLLGKEGTYNSIQDAANSFTPHRPPLQGHQMSKKKRLDKLLVERGLAQTREKAQALIMAGNVMVNDQPATKAGLGVAEDADLRLKDAPYPYVSRGGVKLEGAVGAFGVEVRSKVCLD